MQPPVEYSVPDNFLGLEPEFSDYARSRYVIVPVPYEPVSYTHLTLPTN